MCNVQVPRSSSVGTGLLMLCLLTAVAARMVDAQESPPDPVPSDQPEGTPPSPAVPPGVRSQESGAKEGTPPPAAAPHRAASKAGASDFPPGYRSPRPTSTP